MSDYTPQEWSALKQDRRTEKLLVEGSRVNRAQIRRAQKLRLPLEALMTAGPTIAPKQRRLTAKTRRHVLHFFLKLRQLVRDDPEPTAE